MNIINGYFIYALCQGQLPQRSLSLLSFAYHIDLLTLSYVSLQGQAIAIFQMIIIFHPSMFSKKKPSTPARTSQQHPSSPLPRLQQLTLLQAQLLSILGRRNVLVDDSADIFTRLEEIYLSSLQGTQLGMEMLEKCLRVVGDCDSPARVRFLYLCAHQMHMKGAAADEVQPVLLDSFHSNLALRHKIDLGFKAGLAFCQMSDHAAEVDKILSSSVVVLEQELGYKPQRKAKMQGQSHSISAETTKAIYLGTRPIHKPHANRPDGRMHKLDMFKMLFQCFVTGEGRVQSQAKRKYYRQCKEELRGRLLREYPGRDIEKKLTAIEEQRYATLIQFGKYFGLGWGKQFPQTTVTPSYVHHTRNPSQQKSKSKSTHKLNIRSKSQATSSAGFQSLKTSFMREPQGSAWGATTTPTHSRKPSFKLQIRRSSKHKIDQKEHTEKIEGPSQRQKQAQTTEMTKLVFGETTVNAENVKAPSSKGKEKQAVSLFTQNGKGIILKFDRLHHQKAQVKKKKLRQTFNWDKQKSQKENNHLEHVINIQCLPQIKQQLSHDHSSLPQHDISPHKIQQQLPAPLEPQRIITSPSVSQFGSARRIDQMLKQGVEWISHLQSEEPVISIPQLQDQHIKEPKNEQSFSDTCHLNSQRQEESRDLSYKIVIKALEKPEIHLIITEEVLGYFYKLNQMVIQGYFGKEAKKVQHRMSRPSKYHKTEIPIKQCQVSIQIRKEANDSQSERVDDVLQSQVIADEKVQQKQRKQCEDVCPNKGNEDHTSEIMILPTEIAYNLEKIIENAQMTVKVECSSSQKQVKVENKQIQQEQYSGIVHEWLTDVQQTIFIKAQQQQKQPTQIQTNSHEHQHHQSPPSHHSLPSLPLSRLKCSIKAQTPSSSSRHASQTNSIDDKQLDSEKESSPPSIQKDHLLVQPIPFQKTQDHIQGDSKPSHLLAPFSDEASHFTCSRFAGSKIDTEKESDFQWRSQINFMNEIFQTDRIQESIFPPLLQIPQKDSNCSKKKDSRGSRLQQSQDFQGQARNNYRSRTQSQRSDKNSNNLPESSITSRSAKRQKAHVCLSFSYNDNYDAVTHSSKKFNHWLSPQLKVRNNCLAFFVVNNGREHTRQIHVPGFVVINDDTIREVSAKLQLFLMKFANKHEVNEQEWEEVKRQMDQVDLLPDECELRTLTICDKDGRQDEIRCVANLKTNRIVPQSLIMGMKISPIVTSSPTQLQTAVSQLNANKFCLKSNQILIRDAWCFTGQRNIKLREKSQNNVIHFVFDVLQRYRQNDTFDYNVRLQSGEGISFEGIQPSRRGRIIKNMDTIIGFCLKVVDGKAKFTTQSIKQFLSLL